MDDAKTMSSSVQNQKAHLWNFLISNPSVKYGEVREFIDDGYTGTNLDRPALQELLEMVRIGQVKCIIVKDFSRFGRNYLEVGNYLEQIFPCLNIRFISVDDHYDSGNNKGDVPGLDVAFKNIIHDYYSKELSGKVIQTKRNLARKGFFMGGIPPFGYLRNPEDKHQLIIDPESAKTVGRIFALALEGKNRNEIARILNYENVETPTGRLWRLGIRKGELDETELKKMRWRADAISTILANPVVIGSITNHKVERKALGKPELKLVKKAKHIVVENMHEAIIEKEIFDKVQKMTTVKNQNRTPKSKTAKEYPLSGILKCGYCGKNLVIEGKGSKLYICRYARTVDEERHKGVKLKEDDLLKALANLIADAVMLQGCGAGKKAEMKDEAAVPSGRAEGDLEHKKKMLADAYEDYATGNISKEVYLKQKEKIQEQFAALNSMTAVRKEIPIVNVSEKLIQAVRQNNHSWLTKDLVQGFVKEICIFSERNIGITWKCEDWFIKAKD